jgi:hypothetical protein
VPDLALRAPQSEPDTSRGYPGDSEPDTAAALRRASFTTVARLDVDSKAEVKHACIIHPFSELRFYWDVFILV